MRQESESNFKKRRETLSLRGLVAVNRNWTLNDVGLLFFRVMVAASLFWHHGWEKLSGFSHMSQHFLDPLHIGPVPSLLYAAFADGICSLLIIFGVGTRIASFFALINMVVVYFVAHNALGLAIFKFVPPPGMPAPPPMPGIGGHLELVFLYLAGFLLLTIVGGGALAFDRMLGRKR
jgi:putative oxidoreductase